MMTLLTVKKTKMEMLILETVTQEMMLILMISHMVIQTETAKILMMILKAILEI